LIVKDEQLLPEDELFHSTPRKLMTKNSCLCTCIIW